jgi:curved DNA-binding protein CbpA
VPPKDPRVVLGVGADATPDEIKAAWRALARRHHPDLTGDDPEVAQRATRRMAEINAAYAHLTREAKARRARAARPSDAPPGATDGAGTRRHGGPPPDRPTRPVTARVDMSHVAQTRNQTTTPPGAAHPLRGQPPLRHDRSVPDLRASQPSGPLEYGRLDGYIAREAPDLDDALDVEVDFGKFHGHTLGEIAAFEPSYIDWLAGTLVREPELALAARVIAQELDRRGIRRVHRPPRRGWSSNPFP